MWSMFCKALVVIIVVLLLLLLWHIDARIYSSPLVSETNAEVQAQATGETDQRPGG